MVNIKLYIILILTTWSYTTYGQAKKISIPINIKGDTSFYFKHTIKKSKLLKQQDLRIAEDSFCMRIWTDKQCIDIVNNNRKVEATNYFFASPRPEDSTKLIVFNRKTMKPKQAQRLLFLIDSFSIANIKSDNQINCWGKRNGFPYLQNCNDGVSYKIETSDVNKYHFKTYHCPDSWDCTEAQQIAAFFKVIELLLDTEKQFEKFINKLPSGCYNTGSYYNICNNLPKQPKKKSNQNK